MSQSDPSGLCIDDNGNYYCPPASPSPSNPPAPPNGGYHNPCPSYDVGCPGYAAPGSGALPKSVRGSYDTYYSTFSGMTAYPAGGAAYNLNVLALFCGSGNSPGYGQCGSAYGQILGSYDGVGAAMVGAGFSAAATLGSSLHGEGGDPADLARANAAAESDLARLAADEMSQSGQVDVKNGLTRAGFSYQEHMGRGELPRVGGTEFNSAGQNLLDEIITNPGTAWAPITGGKFVGGMYGILPSGQGVAINASFQFQYFGTFEYPGLP